MTTNEIPKPPKGLGYHGRKYWRDMTEQYEFDPEKLTLLRQVARTVDLLERLQQQIDEDPTLVAKGSQGQPVSAPAVGAIKEHRALLVTLTKALELPSEEGADGRMTRPRVGSSRRQCPLGREDSSSWLGIGDPVARKRRHSPEGVSRVGRSRRRRRPEAKRELPEMVSTFKPSTDIADLREHLNAVAAMTGGYGPALDLMNDAGLSVASWYRQAFELQSGPRLRVVE